MQQLEKKLGYTFRNPDLLRLALTHPSCQQCNNQRMEFLGDAVLELCISDTLYRLYPDSQEGELTAMRIRLVDEFTLSTLARRMDLGSMLIMLPGEEATGGRDRSGNLCDAFEAVLAAVYLDGGFPAAQKVVANLFADPQELIDAHANNDKSDLQIWVQAHKLSQPVYEIVETSGPMHYPTFRAQVRVNGIVLSEGEGHSKREAEKAAAAKALVLLREPSFADSILLGK